uniref:Uncharacterized protein n=1 Tax=Timema monikensis TaxID=170555 RepID=A0A7R9EFX9_9NEOP|nr:unnamed protein product [Timema monikensis]
MEVPACDSIKGSEGQQRHQENTSHGKGREKRRTKVQALSVCHAPQHFIIINIAAMEMEVMEGALQVALPRLAVLLAAMETAKASPLVPASGLDLSLLAFHKLKVLRIREALLIRISRTDN